MAKSTTKSKKLLQKRTKLEQVLLTILIVLILLLLLAASFDWWPFNSPYGGRNLGTAFYTAAPNAEDPGSGGSADGSSASGSPANSGGNGSNGATGAAGSSGSNGSSGTTPAPTPATSSAIFNFSAGVDTGNTKQETSGQANGLNEHCALLVNSSTAGKQEVCTYTEGDKIVTVTYLNDRVVSASRSGF